MFTYYSFQNTRIYTQVYVSEYFQNQYRLILINNFCYFPQPFCHKKCLMYVFI